MDVDILALGPLLDGDVQVESLGGVGEDLVRQLVGDLLDQELAWEACDFGSPALNTRFGAIPGTACADVTVPRDWKDPQDGHTITVRVAKTETSKGNPDRQGIALVNPGGPGGSGLPWGPAMAERAPELAEQYDFIGFDPRGVGQSTALE